MRGLHVLLHVPLHIIFPRKLFLTDLAKSIHLRDVVFSRITWMSSQVVTIHVSLVSFTHVAVGAGKALDGLFVIYHVLAGEVSEG